MKLPIVPPPLKNHGLVIATLSDVVVWLKEELEKLGIMVFEGFAGNELLMDGDRVRGVRLMDRGVNPDGTAGATFAPGADITAQVTIFGEGSRGSLTKQLVEKLKLQGPNPQIYGTGCKEVWRLPRRKILSRKGDPLRRMARVVFAVRRLLDLRDERAPGIDWLCDRARCQTTLE